jgi:hypothetical protein
LRLPMSLAYYFYSSPQWCMVMNQAGVRILGGDVFQELVEIISGVAQPAARTSVGHVRRLSTSKQAPEKATPPLGLGIGLDAIARLGPYRTRPLALSARCKAS